MKKKILFMMINMNIGGTEKALLNMLEEMDKNQYDVTIMMLEEYGGFLKQIPKWVNIKYFENYKDIRDILNISPQITVKNLINKGRFIKGFNIGLLHVLSKITKDRSTFFRYVLKNHKVLDEEYDLAVAYAGPMDFISYYVIYKIRAENKIQWVHFDVTKIGFNKVFASKVYSKFDKIFVVSNEAKDKLDNLVPILKNKTEVFFNIISSKNIQKMAIQSLGFNDNFNGTRILTVGRLSKEKGQDLTISVLARLKQDGYNVRWYCIGEGSSRNEYEKLIKKYKLEKDYILLGSNPNPYPYMRNCDIYVQPSRHEGYCITLAEVKCFGKTIITTDFTGVREHISNEMSCLVVKFNEEEMYKAIKSKLNDDLDILTLNCFNENIDKSNKELDKLFNFL